MKLHHIERRKKWLECSREQYERLPSPEKTYLLSAIRDYARLCFIERRKQDFDRTSSDSRVLWVLWVVVALVGGVAFSSLPYLFLGKLGVSFEAQSFFAYLMGAALGVAAHIFVSTYLKEIMLKRKYNIMKATLDKYRVDPDKPVKEDFYVEQKAIFESVEKELEKYPSPIILILAITFSIIEFATVWSILSRSSNFTSSSTDQLGVLWVLIGCILSLLLLWGLSWIKAFLFLVPKDCRDLMKVYIDEQEKIDDWF